MTLQPDIHVQSFCIVINKQRDYKNTGTTYTSSNKAFTISTDSGGLEISGRLRKIPGTGTVEGVLDRNQQLILVSGDVTLNNNPGGLHDHPKCSGSAAQIIIDFQKQEINIFASIVGLPPVFFWESAERLVITSDIYLLLDIAGCSLSFDVEGIRELTTIGYPIGSKTLFKGVKMLPAGHLFAFGNERGISISRHWSLPSHQQSSTWHEFLEDQSGAFQEAMENINVSRSFLSLTAGMDTRAILSSLTALNTHLPAYTMSGPTLSLDAHTARVLCRAYEIEYNTVTLDTDFLSELPHQCSEACRLTGGLASLSQAHEIYFYSKVKNNLIARLSGNLGNQVGRGGAENISLRNAGFLTFDPAIHPSDDSPQLSHWYTPYIRSGGNLSFDFLLEQEIPFSSVGNYSLSNNFAAQQSPYADRRLIEISANRPRSAEKTIKKSLIAMRLKDLRHRFLGESIETSFQRKFIKETGGAVAEIPINWGGRAKGGISPSGTIRGMMALIDAALSSKGIDKGPIYQLASIAGIAGVHEYRSHNLWLKGPLKEFALDLFSSKSTRECGLFDSSALEKQAHLYFSNQAKTFKNISLSLDLALASKIFNAHL